MMVMAANTGIAVPPFHKSQHLHNTRCAIFNCITQEAFDYLQNGRAEPIRFGPTRKGFIELDFFERTLLISALNDLRSNSIGDACTAIAFLSQRLRDDGSSEVGEGESVENEKRPEATSYSEPPKRLPRIGTRAVNCNGGVGRVSHYSDDAAIFYVRWAANQTAMGYSLADVPAYLTLDPTDVVRHEADDSRPFTGDHMHGDAMFHADYYQEQAVRTRSNVRDNEIAILGLGIAGEAGEVADLIKKHIGHGHPLDRDKLIKELGDVQWYIAVIAQSINVDLSVVMKANIDKLKARYPEGFSNERSMNREEES